MFVLTFLFFQILQSLTLLHTDISTIDQHALQGTEGKLRNMNVRNCIFNGNVSFSWLNAPTVVLSLMDIRQLTRTSFQGVLNLKYLTLSNLNLTAIKKQAFPNMRTLRRIYISECPLVTLAGLENLRSLSELYIVGASIQTILYEAIAGLRSLKYLNMRKGSLEYIFPGMINKTNNSLQSWTDNVNSSKTMSCSMHGETTEYGLHNLTKIDFSQNSIQFIFPGTFCYFPSLLQLYLQRNRIRDLHVDSFLGSQNLDILDLSSNEITFLPQGIFSSLPNLQNLRLNENNIKHIYSVVFNPLSIITHNDSTYGPATIKYLFLRNNHIKTIDRYAFQSLVSLKLLGVSYNYIDSLEVGTFYGLNVLEILYINYNQITHINGGVFTTLPMLHYLQAMHNKIKYLNPKAFSNCTRLEELSLAFNEISELHPELLTGLIHLKRLSLRVNKITFIHIDTFKSNKRLSLVDLSSNHIQTIDSGAFLPVPLLGILHLQNNQIHSVTKDIFFVSHYLNLVGNPLKCRCDLYWMKNMTKVGVSWYLPLCNVSTKLSIYKYLDKFCCENEHGVSKRPALPSFKRYKHMNTIIFTGSMLFVTVVVIIVLLIRRHKKNMVRSRHPH